MKVKVVNKDCKYSTYFKMAEKYKGFTYSKNTEVRNGEILDLIEYTCHDTFKSREIAICKNECNNLIIIDKEGVEEMEKYEAAFKVGDLIESNYVKGEILYIGEMYYFVRQENGEEYVIPKRLAKKVTKPTWSEWEYNSTYMCLYRVKGDMIQVKRIGERGYAKCSPQDKFDLDKGVAIACKRMEINKIKDDIRSQQVYIDMLEKQIKEM